MVGQYLCIESNSFLLLPPSLCFLFTPMLSQDAVVHPCWPPTMLFWCITKGSFHTFEEGVLKANLTFCLSAGRCWAGFWTRSCLLFWSPRLLILLFVLLPSFRVLNCTASQFLMMRLLMTFVSYTNSWFVSNELESSPSCWKFPNPYTVLQTIPFTV